MLWSNKKCWLLFHHRQCGGCNIVLCLPSLPPSFFVPPPRPTPPFHRSLSTTAVQPTTPVGNEWSGMSGAPHVPSLVRMQYRRASPQATTALGCPTARPTYRGNCSSDSGPCSRRLFSDIQWPAPWLSTTQYSRPPL